jgi:hypothetical protein
MEKDNSHGKRLKTVKKTEISEKNLTEVLQDLQLFLGLLLVNFDFFH